MEKLTLQLANMESYARERGIPVITADGAKLLADTVRAKQPRRILEIGTAIGYSALLMASCQGADGVIVTIEQDEERLKDARRFIAAAGMEERISILAGDAAEVVKEVRGPFDMVFIDAAKGQYLAYLQQIIGQLADGAVIAADNVAFRGMVKDGQPIPRRFRTLVRRLQAYLEFVSTHPSFVTTVYDDGDGMAISHYTRGGASL